MITYDWLYVLAGAAFAVWAGLSAKDGRWGNAAFWALLAASFFFGSYLSDFANGVLVLALVAIAGLGGAQAQRSADHLARGEAGAGRAARQPPVPPRAGRAAVAGRGDAAL